MTRFVLSVVCVLSGGVAAADPTANARAALALAFAEPSYADRYAAAARAGKPLVVWVGQPAKAVPGCVSVRADGFPDAAKVGVVVGVPSGRGFRRADLPGTPRVAVVAAAVTAARGDPAPAGALLPAK
jgi:hypothetical protein